MKLKIITAALLVFTSVSCKKTFLDVPPETSISSNTFFKTTDDFTQAINGVYAGLHDLYETAYVMGEMRSDNAYLVYKSNDRGGQNVTKEQVASFTDDPQNQYSNTKYYSCYTIISRANAVLGAIDAAVLDDTFKKNIKGQAEFLRAFAYFELVQYFGSVPLYLKVVTTQAAASLPQSSVADVYKQIIADATDAAAILPAPSAQAKGSVSSGSAYMLLGYINMTLKNYAAAETALKAVTGLGYSLLANYADVFNPANKNNAESIFEVQYAQGASGVQSDFAYMFIPAVTDTKPITGVTGNNQTFGGWNTPTADLIASYETGDKRRGVTIAMGYTNASGTFIAQPYTIKYLHPHAVFNNTDDDWLVYRYADALLLLAECLNEENKSAAALPLLNQVRARAGLAPSATTDQSQLRDVIAHERRIELAFENHRWLDLVRTGKAVAVMNAYGIKQKQTYSYLLPNTYNVTANRLVFPIPFNEIVLNPVLIQNPGYN